MNFLASSYDHWVVFASIVVATFSSYVALDLAKRVRTSDRKVAAWWLCAGSLAMGTGIWAMHFVGMLAFRLPIELGYDITATMASWGAGVATSAVALSVAAFLQLTPLRLGVGSLAMGGGICAMHYIGMAALDVSPPIVWDWRLVAASAAIAVGASAAALVIFFWLRKVSSTRGLIYQCGAALIMGFAISGMHYTGMAAANFPQGSVCVTRGTLGGAGLGLMVIVASLLMLVATLLTSLLDAHLQQRAALLVGSLSRANAELRDANAELQKKELYDSLTQLPNRLLFEDRLREAVARSDSRSLRHGGLHLAVLFVDLDGFKPVNDSFGHHVGDTVLREAALRLQATAREHDTVARVGGDEFLLLLDQLPAGMSPDGIAQRVVAALRDPFVVGGTEIRIGASVGVALYPEHGTHDKLLMRADAAMHVAKRSGGHRGVIFAPHMEAEAHGHLGLHNELSMAIDRNQLMLHYQPKVDVRTGRIRGAEALLRWKHPQRGMVSPAEFIPLAERFGIIHELGSWVIEEACRQMGEWSQQGLKLRVAINLSRFQLADPALAERIGLALQRHGVEPSHLLCEITESVAMTDVAAAQRAFADLARIGVYLAIDDFGTGYSSLSVLRQLPARQLKIDRSFITDLAKSRDAYVIVDSIIYLAHALDLKVVAEGVETAQQRDILTQLNCDELQGYLFARPMPASDLFEWARGQKPQDAADFSPSVIDEMVM